MALYKQVNGIKVQLTDKEEAGRRSEWKKNNVKKKSDEEELHRENLRKTVLKSSVSRKLLSLGFTEDEIDFLL